MILAELLILAFLLCLLVAWAALHLKMQRGLSILLRQGPEHVPATANRFVLLVPFAEAPFGLQPLLNSLAQQDIDWEKGEILLLADHVSAPQLKHTEQTLAQYHESLPLRLIIHQGAPGKKNALFTGYRESSAEIMVQSDADVRWQPGALAALLDPFADEEQALVMAYVKMEHQGSLTGRLAAMDFFSLQAAGHGLAASGQAIMANGAGMAYRRVYYDRHYQVGQEQNSGDDVFLLQAIAKAQKGKIGSALGAQVMTAAPATPRAFIRQRVRWGAKTNTYPSLGAKFIAGLVALYNASILAFLVGGCYDPRLLLAAGLLWLPKIWLDGQLLSAFARDLGQEWSWLDYAWSAFCYPFYISLTVLMILIGPRSWREW